MADIWGVGVLAAMDCVDAPLEDLPLWMEAGFQKDYWLPSSTFLSFYGLPDTPDMERWVAQTTVLFHHFSLTFDGFYKELKSTSYCSEDFEILPSSCENTYLDEYDCALVI